VVERDRRSTVVEGDVDESQVSVRVDNGQSRPAALPGDGAPGVGTSAATCIER
jgi:hypothetical protein